MNTNRAEYLPHEGVMLEEISSIIKDVPTGNFVDASGVIFNLFKDKAIASKATTELLSQPLIMEESEVLKVQAADANELHVIASILEIQPREVTT